MKNLLVSVFLLLFCPGAFAGRFIEGKLQRTAALQGQGSTIAEAKIDAQLAMPSGWHEDLNNSPTVECSFWRDAPDGSYCDVSDRSEKIRVTIRIVKAFD